MHAGCILPGVNIEQRQVSFSAAGGGQVQRSYDLLVGADGAGSEVRRALQQHYPDMQVTIDDSGREYKVYGGVRGDIEPEGEGAGAATAAAEVEALLPHVRSSWLTTVCKQGYAVAASEAVPAYTAGCSLEAAGYHVCTSTSVQATASPAMLAPLLACCCRVQEGPWRHAAPMVLG